MNWIKRLFSKKGEKQCAIHNVSHSYTLGERDEKGFCDLYRDAEKTNVRILTFTPKEAKKLQDIADKIIVANVESINRL